MEKVSHSVETIIRLLVLREELKKQHDALQTLEKFSRPSLNLSGVSRFAKRFDVPLPKKRW